MNEICAPDTIIWHNVDLSDKRLFDYLPYLRAVREAAAEWRYTETGYWESEDRFFRQTRVEGHSRGGASFLIATFLIGAVADGRIVRIDEFYDGAGVAPLAAKLGADGGPVLAVR